MKLQIIYLAVCSLTTQAVYISRMATISRMRTPAAFRPGVSLQQQQRPWNPPRFAQASSHRAPYVLYRNAPHRYVTKPYAQGTRNLYNVGSGPWKTTSRQPFTASTPEYEFVRSASVQHPLRLQANGGKGAIHTIPAPNLSLSEKPIVVLEASDGQQTSSNHVATDSTQQTYEVTEKHVDPTYYHNLLGTKTIEATAPPAGFSKQGQLSSQDLNALVRNSAALQMASDYGLQAIALPQTPLIQSQPQQHIALQSYPRLHNPPDLMRQGLEGIIIPPNALYQHDPNLLQKIQSTLLQRFPTIEFVPYNPDLQSQMSTPVYVLNNNDATKLTNQQQLSVLPIDHNENHKTVVRETQESNLVTIIPKSVTPSHNITDNEVIPVPQPHNISLEIVATETQTQPQTTTVKYVIETSTEDQSKLAPIYYAQVGQSVGNVIANGFFSAINDVRAAAALGQVEKPKAEESKKVEIATSTTTINPDVKQFFVQSVENNDNNETVNDLKPLLGVPFAKTDSVKIAYTLHRTDDKDSNVTNDGKVYAGQIIEATISEDHDFNKEKADLLSRRAPLRLVPVPDIKAINKQTIVHNNQINIRNQHQVAPSATVPKYSVVKAKIPPKSKLTFDDKTGEPILRIYASYVDSPTQKEVITTKLANLKHVKDVVGKTDGSIADSWKIGTVRALSKDHTSSDVNKVTQFGLKLKSRMDDITPIFDDYERKR